MNFISFFVWFVRIECPNTPNFYTTHLEYNPGKKLVTTFNLQKAIYQSGPESYIKLKNCDEK